MRVIPLRSAPFVVAVLLLACTPGGSSWGSASGPRAAELTIYAAASLTTVLHEAKAAYERANPGTTLKIATDSSTALRTQIEQGAPADLFLSADAANPQALADAGLADGAPVDFAGNLLTIAVPIDNPAGIARPSDLARQGVRIVAAGQEVPITKYAAKVIERLAARPGYPADFGNRYADNVVSREDNVKAVVAKLELGEADAGIVYVTDARASTRLSTIQFPSDSNVPATYAGAVIKASAHRSEATAFLRWLVGPEGQAMLAAFGFSAPP